MASKIVKMVLKLDDKASPGLKKVGGEANTTTGGMASLRTGALAAAGGLAAIGTAAIASIKFLEGLADEMKETVNTFGDMSGITGMSTELLETFDLMARSTGSDIKKLERGFVTFGRGMSDAANGTGELNRVLETLPMSFDPSAFDTMDEKVLGFIESVRGMESVGDQAAAMTAAFGRAAIDLQKALNTGDVEAYREEMERIGFVAGPEAVAATQRMQRATALQEIMIKRLKMAAFDAFMGPDGYVSYLAATVGVMKTLSLAIGDVWETTAGFAMTLFNLNKAFMSVQIGDFRGAVEGAEGALESFQRMWAGGGALQGNWASYMKEGRDAAESLEESLAKLGEESRLTAEQQADQAAMLEALRKTQEQNTASAVSGSNKRKKAAEEEISEWDKLNASITEAFETWSGAEAGVDRLVAQLGELESAFDQLADGVEGSLNLDDWSQSVSAGIDEILAEIESAIYETEQMQQAQADLISSVTGAGLSLAGGDVSGAAGTVATAAGLGPVIGSVIGAIGAVAEIGEMTVQELKNNAKSFADNLEKGFENIAKALPSVVNLLMKRLPGILVEAALTWIPWLIMELPYAISKAIIEAIPKTWDALIQGIRDAIANVFDFDLKGRAKDLFGIGDSYSSGAARISRTGTALVHRGETIIQAGGREAQDQAYRMGTGGGVTVNISTSIMDRDVIPRLVREIDRAVGKYGRTSAAFSGG